MIEKEQIKNDPKFSDHTNSDGDYYYPFFYRGFRAEQKNPQIFDALDALAEKVKPKQIIEIGTNDGGFTKILEDHPISESAEIYSIDITPKVHQTQYSKANIVYGDCFKLELYISNKIKKDGTSIVFCDGGHKNLEIQTYAKYLKQGDLILGHDYVPTKEQWEKEYLNEKWDWHETWDSQIEETIEREGLEDYLQPIFQEAVWKCLIKK